MSMTPMQYRSPTRDAVAATLDGAPVSRVLAEARPHLSELGDLRSYGERALTALVRCDAILRTTTERGGAEWEAEKPIVERAADFTRAREGAPLTKAQGGGAVPVALADDHVGQSLAAQAQGAIRDRVRDAFGVDAKAASDDAVAALDEFGKRIAAAHAGAALPALGSAGTTTLENELALDRLRVEVKSRGLDVLVNAYGAFLAVGDEERAIELETASEAWLLDLVHNDDPQRRLPVERREETKAQRQKALALLSLFNDQRSRRTPSSIALAADLADLFGRCFRAVVGFTGSSIPAATLARIYAGGATSTAKLPGPLDVAPEWHVRTLPGAHVGAASSMKRGTS